MNPRSLIKKIESLGENPEQAREILDEIQQRKGKLRVPMEAAAEKGELETARDLQYDSLRELEEKIEDYQKTLSQNF